MADEQYNKTAECETKEEGSVETKDRGLFDFMGKKKEKPQEEVIATEFGQKVQVCEPETKEEPKEEGEEKKHGLLDKLHRSGSSSSSSSDEEEGVGEEKKKKKKEKKGLKEKMSGEKEEEKDNSVQVEVVHADPTPSDEKKGFLDKIKEKLPGQHKKQEESAAVPPSECAPSEGHGHDGEAKEKKGILEKIKEKLPGYHPKNDEDKKEEKEKECPSH